MRGLAITIAHGAGFERYQIAAARMFCERHVLATLKRASRRKKGRILCYHSVGQPEFGVNDVSPARFEHQLKLALRAGYKFVPASTIARGSGASNELAITFDDGLKSVFTVARPILRDLVIPYTVFVVTEWCNHSNPLAKSVLSWRELEQILNEGSEIGSHSVSHPDFAQIGYDQIVHELVTSRSTIQRRLGFSPDSFAIPLGQSMNWSSTAQRAALDAGYNLIYAQAEETRPKGTIARTFVTSFDNVRLFSALLEGAYDHWEEWV